MTLQLDVSQSVSESVSESVSDQGDVKAMALPSRQRPWQKGFVCTHINCIHTIYKEVDAKTSQSLPGCTFSNT